MGELEDIITNTKGMKKKRTFLSSADFYASLSLSLSNVLLLCAGGAAATGSYHLDGGAKGPRAPCQIWSADEEATLAFFHTYIHLGVFHTYKYININIFKFAQTTT